MKKISKFISILSALTISASCIPYAACGNGNGGDAGQYTIKFHVEGGEEIENLKYSANTTVTLPVPVKEGGWAFAGWFPNEDCIGQAVFTLNGASGDKEYWAKWQVAKYDVKYRDGTKKLNGEGWITQYTAADAAETSLSLPVTANKKGYNFEGWYDNAELTGDPVTAIPQGSEENKTYYSKWSIVNYTIHYETNTDLCELDDEYYTVAQSYELTIPQDYEYLKFLGWHETADFSDKAVERIKRGVTGDKTYYAEWEGTQFDINYELNGGSWNGQYPVQYTFGKATTLVSPVKEGLVFAGWYDNAEFAGERLTEIPVGKSGDLKLYAKFKEADYKITYVLNGGSFTGDFLQGFDRGDTSEIVAPARGWYEFKGWYENADFSGSPLTSVAGKQSNLTLYAKWEKATYKLNLETYGGTLTGEQISFGEGDKINQSLTLSKYKPEKPGYKFEGWYNNPDFLGDQIKSFVVDENTNPGDVTYYAKYSLITYTLTYKFNNGSLDTKVSFTIEDEVKLLETIPERKGYTFGGWYRDNNYQTPAENLPAGTSGNITFYAKWTANVYNITYNLDGGVLPAGAVTTYTYRDFEANKHRYDEEQITWLPVPTKAGKVFGGWYEEQTSTPDASKVKGAVLVGESGDKTYYALWLDGELSAATSKLMEAEHTNLTGKSGPGYSGSGLEGGMIGFQSAASNGQCITYTHGANVFVDWEFSLDREVKNATITIQLGSELGGDYLFSNECMEIRINGVLYSAPWSILVKDTQNGSGNKFVTLDLKGISLRAGFNVISLETLDVDFNGNPVGPAFDCITVTANANINFTPIIWKENE